MTPQALSGGLLLLLALVSPGCFPAAPPNTPQSQAQALLGKKRMGHLDSKWSTDSSELWAYAPSSIDEMADRPLRFESIGDGKICFYTATTASKLISAGDVRHLWAKKKYVIVAYDSPAEIQALTAFPQSGPGFDSIDILSKAVLEDGTHRKVELKLCGPAPAVSEKTKMLAVMMLPEDGYVGYLYLWSVGDAP